MPGFPAIIPEEVDSSNDDDPPGHDAECQVVIKSNATRCSPTGSIWDLEKWLVEPSRNHKSPGLLEIFLQRADSRIGGVT